jgi:hypothetical protein
MKKIILLFGLILSSMKLVFCQESMIVNENEVIQVLERYVYMSNLPDHFYSNIYAVKLVKEKGSDEYSIAITNFRYSKELPKDSLLYIEIKNKGLFIILNNEITFGNKYTSNFISNVNRIDKILDSLLYKGAVVYYPNIVIFSVNHKNCFSKKRIVRFETFIPIINVPRKYWPISNRVGAIIDDLPNFDIYDTFGNEKEDWKAIIRNGKGKFKINASDARFKSKKQH